MTESSTWLPIVWGRTRTGDSWWRARPTGPQFGEWVTDLVGAVFAGGADLATPRFLLARSHGYWATGVACSAADLNASMSMDAHGRELFAFVGWLAPADEDAVVLPTLADWEVHRAQWAGTTYTRWCRPDWEKHWSDAAIAQPSVPEDAPWPTGIRPPAAALAPLSTDDSRAVLHPEADAAQLWAAGIASTTPFVLVTGWAGTDALDPDRLTHATVRGLPEPRPVVRRGAPSLIEPEPAHEPDDDLDPPRHDLETTHPEPGPQRTPTGGPRRGWRDRLTDVVGPSRWDALLAEVHTMRDELDRCRQEVAELRARVEQLSSPLQSGSASPAGPHTDGSPAEGADGTG